MAHHIEKGLVCQLCGTAHWQWDEDPHGFEAVSETCRGCYVVESASQGVTKQAGTRVVLSSTRTPEARRRRAKEAELRRRDKSRRTAGK